MTVQIGYLLPTRERIMAGDPGTTKLLDSGRRAADLGYDSLWAGDSLIARPRHDPLTLLAAAAASIPRVLVGTAVLLPALRNPVVLAQQLATVDQISEGRLVIGAGIAADTPAIRAEFAAAGVPFEGRVGRFMEGLELCRALWRGEPVSWKGRWELDNATLAPTPYRSQGPEIWVGTGADAGIARTARHFDGWFPIGPDIQTFTDRQARFVEQAQTHGRDPARLTTALYLTLCINKDSNTANAAIDDYLQGYYGAPAKVMRQVQACYGGPLDDVLGFMRSYVAAGASHLVLRLAGDHNSQLQLLGAQRHQLEI
jgi:alkanesulfonate monooxygenase SsuD/methylene tetrahydromethanopterin reductase-like flavin-dependent oxidoreductase (luciferase family)